MQYEGWSFPLLAATPQANALTFRPAWRLEWKRWINIF
jgi:hypothetical protein